MKLRVGVLSLLVCLGLPQSLVAQTDARELAGLWEAKLRFGPDIRGPLMIVKTGTGWRAEIAGYTNEARLTGETIDFELPDGRGGFRGEFASGRGRIVGHWIQSRTQTSGNRFASPATLVRIGKTERWQGEIDVIEDEFTMYLKVEPRADGSMRAFLKNPERNVGRFIRVASIERDSSVVRLLSAATASQEASVLSEGVVRDVDVMSIPLRGGTYDFARVAESAASDFYPRARANVGKDYVYRVPTALDDGWPVAAPDKAGMSQAKLESFVRMLIDTPIDSLNSPEIHGVLVARHGTLVLEEYFHGENRDKPHDMRSATKSVTSVLVGAASQAKVPVNEHSFVYQVMNGGKFADGLDARKKALTLEHLLTMSSGLDADDNDDNSPGAEDKISEGDEPDYWKLTLALNMIRDPGEKAVYASMQPNLVGAVMQTASGQPLPELFHALLAEPLQIRRYWINLMPSGDAYMGGGLRFCPRDFLKFAQLMVNGGTWGGKRVVSEAWAKKSTSHITEIGTGKYGYLWWINEYPYQGRTVAMFAALGNGGQVVMGIPDLDLAIAIYSGNYNDRVARDVQRRLIPEYVLPAVVGK